MFRSNLNGARPARVSSPPAGDEETCGCRDFCLVQARLWIWEEAGESTHRCERLDKAPKHWRPRVFRLLFAPASQLPLASIGKPSSRNSESQDLHVPRYRSHCPVMVGSEAGRPGGSDWSGGFGCVNDEMPWTTFQNAWRLWMLSQNIIPGNNFLKEPRQTVQSVVCRWTGTPSL